VVKRHKAQIRDQLAFEKDAEISRKHSLCVLCLPVMLSSLFVATAINNVLKSSNTLVVLAYEFSVTLMLSNSSLNPLMYCMRLEDFRTAVKKTYKGIFCFASEDE